MLGAHAGCNSQGVQGNTEDLPLPQGLADKRPMISQELSQVAGRMGGVLGSHPREPDKIPPDLYSLSFH